ncbi:BQ2448_4375 [Microbotryum intermedium]|uniref:ubiquitinyl hydrolase 1 n=1 Tax=Microbotryum intermedium TaxID=269621 RepID=A0A238FNQ6_9BASI|nr:BQ2448_4375 [Microbotryum intermedium]
MSYNWGDDNTYSYRQSYSPRHTSSLASSSSGGLSHELVVASVALVLTSLVIVLTWIALFGRPRSSTLLYFIEGLVGDSWILAVVMGWLGAVDWQRLGAGLAIDQGDDEHHSALSSSSASPFGPSAQLPPQTGDPKGTHYPGLLNAAGNLCFLNATLQSIASITPLLDYLESLPSTSNSPDSVILALTRTLHALNSPSLTRAPPLRPTALAHALAVSSRTRRRLLASRDQQDAHELLGMIREAVEEEVEKMARDARASDMQGLGALLRFGESDKGKERQSSNAPVVRDPWLLLTSQRVQCLTCGYTRDVRHTSDQQVELQVPDIVSPGSLFPFPISHCTCPDGTLNAFDPFRQTHCSLHQLLDEWTKLDLLSDYACRKCCLAATLTKLESQRDRLALVDSATTLTNTPTASAERSTSNSNASTSNGAQRSSNAHAFDPLLDSVFDPASSSSPTNDPAASRMTSSRANRRRKVQKTINQVKEAWDAGDYEKEFGSEIKVEKVFGPAGKLVRFARRPLAFVQTPEILTFHLSRSSHFATGGGIAVKNQCCVDFPEYLDIAPFANDPAFSPNTPSSSSTTFNGVLPTRPKEFYRLSSLVVHYGTHSFGHYVAFRRRPILPPHLRHGPNGGEPSTQLDPSVGEGVDDEVGIQADEERSEWYRISDETVQVASIQHALTGNPFLLFYEKVKSDAMDQGWKQMGKGKGKGKGKKKMEWSFTAMRGMDLGNDREEGGDDSNAKGVGEPRVLRRWELAS